MNETKVQLLKEHYFEGQNVLRLCEYQPNMFVVCIARDDHVYILKRNLNVIQRIRKPGGRSSTFELVKVSFGVLIRDDKRLYCLKSDQIVVLGQARYDSKQSYKSV